MNTATQTRYSTLLSSKRARISETPGRNLLEETESDRARLMFSSPFRRLQQKAQVYSLEDNAAVRSRLTHSLEVSHVGRYIAQLTLKKLNDHLPPRKITAIASVLQNLVETACLMHDIGNPPFGHFGEAAISDWFKKNGEKTIKEAAGKSAIQNKSYRKHSQDFINFDGNCQGLRIVSKLQWNRDEFGLNFTYSQLATYLKYVVPATLIDPNNPLKKKAGFFETEAELVNDIWSTLKMKANSRFPLTYLMEAADDIAYCISDIEDGIEKGLISEHEFFKWVSEKWEEKTKNIKSESKNKISKILKSAHEDLKSGVTIMAFTNFRARLTISLANFAADTYAAEHDDMLRGTSVPIFDHKDPNSTILSVLREIGIEHLYNSPAASNNELAGYSIIRGLLDHHAPLLSCDKKTFDLIRAGKKKKTESGKWLAKEQKLFNRLPKKYCRTYDHEVNKIMGTSDFKTLEWIFRAHLITDYIAGMTDNFALETFQLLSGIDVGSPN